MINKNFIFGGVLIFVLWAALRLINLTILPVFADEAIYIRWSQVMRAEPTLRFLPLSDGKQPLFMWITMPFLKIFSDPLVAGRMVSVLAGLGSLIGLAVMGYLLFKDFRISLTASLLYAITPFFVFFDRLALVDSLLMMFGVWLALLAVLLVKFPRLDLAMIAGGVLAGALLTKSPAIFFAILIPTSLLLVGRTSLRSDLLRLLRLVGLWAVVYAIGFGVYNFLLRLGPGFQMIAIRNKDYVFSLSEILAHPLDPLKPHLGDLADWFPNLLTWPVLALAVGGLVLVFLKRRWVGLFLLSWMLFPLLIQSAAAKVFTPRYILFTVWPVLILAAFALVWVLAKSRLVRRPRAFLLSSLLTVILVFAAIRYDWLLLNQPEKAPLPRNLRSGHLEDWTAGQGIKESAQYLKTIAQKENVLVGTEGFFGTLPDGLQIYLNQIPRVTVIGVGYPISGVSEKLVNSLADNRVFLIANKSRFLIDPKMNGLKLIFFYPKAVNEKGYRDELLLFELDKNFWVKKTDEN